MMVGYVS